MWTFLVLLVVIAVATDDPAEQEAVADPPPQEVAVAQPEPAPKPDPEPEPVVERKAEPEPDPKAEPDPEPEPAASPPARPTGWEPLDYKLDGHDRVTLGGGKSHWLYIYLPGESSTEQMIATAMQAALTVYRQEGGDHMVVSVMEGPGEDYPLETIEFYPGGCPEDKACAGGLWVTPIELPAAVVASMPVGEPVKPLAAEKPDAVSGAVRNGDWWELEHDRCRMIMARTKADLEAATLFCEAFDSGVWIGAGADSALLRLWVDEPMARDLLGDQLAARRIGNGLVDGWSNRSGIPFPTVMVYWEDVLVMTASGRARGTEVTFGD